MLVGGLCLVLAFVNGVAACGRRSRQGEMPLYRTRLRRGRRRRGANIGALVALNVALVVVLLVIAADLLFGLDLRGR